MNWCYIFYKEAKWSGSNVSQTCGKPEYLVARDKDGQLLNLRVTDALVVFNS